MTAARREQLFSYVVLGVLSIVAIYPILSIVLLAFHRKSDLVTGFSIPDRLSFDTFSRAWTLGGFDHGLVNSFIVAASVAVVTAILSAPAGYAFGTMRFRGSNVLFYLLLIGLIFPYEATVIPLYYVFNDAGITDSLWALILPQTIATVVVAIAWVWIYAPDGPLNEALRAVGLGSITRGWLGDFNFALPALGLVGTWVMFGLCMDLFLAGIQKIPSTLYEAARVDGAGAVREFFAVTLPGLRSELAVALTLTTIMALRSFDLVYVATNGGPGSSTTVPGVLVYRNAFSNGAVGLAAAVAVVLTLIIFAVAFLITKVVDRDPSR